METFTMDGAELTNNNVSDKDTPVEELEQEPSNGDLDNAVDGAESTNNPVIDNITPVEEFKQDSSN